MKIICKTVSGASAEIEVDPSNTLADLKVRDQHCFLLFGGLSETLKMRLNRIRGMLPEIHRRLAQI
jgi:hypothetical protein